LGTTLGRRQERMDLELAEASAERGVLRRRQVLVAEEEHFEREERALDLGEGLVVERPPQVDGRDLGAERRAHLLDADAREAHRRQLLAPRAQELPGPDRGREIDLHGTPAWHAGRTR